MNSVDFKNLVGRVGRIEFNLYGNVFLVRLNKQTETKKYIELIENDVPIQKLSVVSELTKPQKQLIVDSLSKGTIELSRHPKKQSNDNYDLMRKFALILLRDIMLENNSLVVKEFSNLLTPDIVNSIKLSFKKKTTDDDINISIDQVENLTDAIKIGLCYPNFNDRGHVDYKQLVSFLERLCSVFKWDKYEASTLGHVGKKSGKHGKLRWYAVILSQWIKGNGLSLIIKDAIQHKVDNPSSGVEIDGKVVDYDDSLLHRNVVISDTLNAIEEVILFRISNYFLRFSAEYKRFHKLSSIPNDWYEYVEYGTTNPLTIFLQRNGFSREAATYIKKHPEYIEQIDLEYKVKSSILNCQSRLVCKEATEIRYNIPELFS